MSGCRESWQIYTASCGLTGCVTKPITHIKINMFKSQLLKHIQHEAHYITFLHYPKCIAITATTKPQSLWEFSLTEQVLSSSDCRSSVAVQRGTTTPDLCASVQLRIAPTEKQTLQYVNTENTQNHKGIYCKMTWRLTHIQRNNYKHCFKNTRQPVITFPEHTVYCDIAGQINRVMSIH